MKNIRSKTPGPGFYNIPSSFAVTPNYVGINNEFRKTDLFVSNLMTIVPT